MKKGIVSLVGALVGMQVHAASEQIVWGKASQTIPHFKQHNQFSAKAGPLKILNNTQQKDYQLKLLEPNSAQEKHVRYQLTYKNIPIFGHQLIFHNQGKGSSMVTGMNVTDIEQDVHSIEGKLSAVDAEQTIFATIAEPIKHKAIQKVIFIDDEKKAHLAYHLSFYINKKEQPVSAPNYLLDANDGHILKHWNEAHHEAIGQGMGGNSFPLPYRAGVFQHGNALPGLNSLGKFEVQELMGRCHVQNDNVRVINLENSVLGYDAFPITIFDEAVHELQAFSYPCSASSLYLNYADGATGPVNYSFSPVNDTMYFAQQTLNMYSNLYGIPKPLGDDLPLRAYTHLGGMDNAFAIPTIRNKGLLLAHQQIVIGNGERFLTAPAQSVVAHELSHNFTALNSGLFYEGQSGGLNEAFSDMAAIALQDYLRKEYPWYWDEQDWTLGREATIGGVPLRHMDEPTKDGYSIGNAEDYTDDIDVHFSSGVFNKAFYLLSHQPGWSVQQAFQIMVDANQHYWSPIAYFDFASCGVIQAAIDRDLDINPVIDSFAKVGVFCPMFTV